MRAVELASLEIRISRSENLPALSQAASTVLRLVADVLAHQCGYTNNVENVKYEVDEEAAEAIGLPLEQLESIKSVMISEVNRAQEAFQM